MLFQTAWQINIVKVLQLKVSEISWKLLFREKVTEGQLLGKIALNIYSWHQNSTLDSIWFQSKKNDSNEVQTMLKGQGNSLRITINRHNNRNNIPITHTINKTSLFFWSETRNLLSLFDRFLLVFITFFNKFSQFVGFFAYRCQMLNTHTNT